jgi:3-isopropylmalate/(R)-2-methylmalate dehydratase small subunit
MSASVNPAAVLSITGRAIPLRGHDIDTDRIMPARFLKAVSFEGLEKHVFEDDKLADRNHAFNNPRYTGASILVVNGNFGCGSSREHAPQGLARAGIRAIVGESFSEIFQGNATMMGMPCFTADADAIGRLQSAVEATPDVEVTADVASGTLTAGALKIAVALPRAVRDSFLSGQWNPTVMLLDRFEQVRDVAGRLPYITGF